MKNNKAYPGDIFKIRYNTMSKSDKNCWRIIDSDGDEFLVDDIIIKTHCFTTKDWMEETQEYKYHLSCKGTLVINDNCAIIS
jgi:hypothetical protein